MHARTTPLWPWFEPQVVHKPIIEDIDITDGNKKPYPSPPILTQIYPKPPQKKTLMVRTRGCVCEKVSRLIVMDKRQRELGGLNKSKRLPPSFSSSLVDSKNFRLPLRLAETDKRPWRCEKRRTNKQTNKQTDPQTKSRPKRHRHALLRRD